MYCGEHPDSATQCTAVSGCISESVVESLPGFLYPARVLFAPLEAGLDPCFSSDRPFTWVESEVRKQANQSVGLPLSTHAEVVTARYAGTPSDRAQEPGSSM